MTQDYNQMRLEARTDLNEAELIDLAMVSALPWAKGREILQLPEAVRGLSILDVGGGASDITATLLEMGADAYAIDPKYEKKSAMIETMRIQVHTAPSLPIRILINQTLKKFVASSKAASEKYKAALATKIPFPDHTFDLVFSMDTVTAFLDRNRETLLQAAKECFRVTKPGGVLKFSPFQDLQPAWTPEVNALRMKNDEEMLDWLKNHPDVESVEIIDTRVKYHHLLTVKKKAGAGPSS